MGYNYDTTTKTYTVYNADGLLAWNEAAQKDESINCTLTADINLTGKEWTPIGDNDNRYTGTFDGGNYTITGLTVNQEGTNYVGLIGFIGSDGTVKNVKLENVNITGSYYVGGVVGYNSGSVTACTSSGSVEGSIDVGGVVGDNYGSVTACYWSDYAGNGIGSGNGGETTLVDGTDVTWADAVDAMNAALTGNDYQWVLGPDGLPVLQSNQ